jgi:hypothetical protein
MEPVRRFRFTMENVVGDRVASHTTESPSTVMKNAIEFLVGGNVDKMDRPCRLRKVVVHVVSSHVSESVDRGSGSVGFVRSAFVAGIDDAAMKPEKKANSPRLRGAAA